MSAHSCVRMENGDVWCWGINSRGEVGRPSQTFCSGGITKCNPLPEKLVLPAIKKLGVAEEHSCAIALDGTVYCWGRDVEGQFGDGLATDTVVPVMVVQRAGASVIGGGLAHGCSLHGDAVKCSGNNLHGEVGDPTMVPRPTPFLTVTSGTDALANGYQHACSIQGGFVYCWGTNGLGQVTGTVGLDVYNPTIVPGVATASAIALGYGHSCAVLANGDMRCWGSNNSGQLGVGDTAPHFGSISTPMVLGIAEVAAGADHTCARTPAGSVYCWGERYTSTPAEVVLPRPAIAIAAGSYHDCFLLDDGTVRCRGFNGYGQLGTGGVEPVNSSTLSQVELCP